MKEISCVAAALIVIAAVPLGMLALLFLAIEADEARRDEAEYLG